jgi:hypothetical protein
MALGSALAHALAALTTTSLNSKSFALVLIVSNSFALALLVKVAKGLEATRGLRCLWTDIPSALLIVIRVWGSARRLGTSASGGRAWHISLLLLFRRRGA